MKKTKKGFALLLCVAALIQLGCSASQINAGINITASLFKGFSINNEQLASESRRSVVVMDKKNHIAPAKNKYTRRLNKLSRNLKHYEGLNLNFKVYQSKTINAFAMPDGTVRVYSGLMDIMNDDELLAVIGHEIGHVKRQHSLKQYRKAYVSQAAAAGLVAYGGRTVSALASSYGRIGLSALNAQFSQKDELEADAYGVKVLHDLGRNPYAAADAQRKLMAHGGGKGGFFSSHPASRLRIERAIAAADKITKK